MAGGRRLAPKQRVRIGAVPSNPFPGSRTHYMYCSTQDRSLPHGRSFCSKRSKTNGRGCAPLLELWGRLREAGLVEDFRLEDKPVARPKCMFHSMRYWGFAKVKLLGMRTMNTFLCLVLQLHRLFLPMAPLLLLLMRLLLLPIMPIPLGRILLNHLMDKFLMALPLALLFEALLVLDLLLLMLLMQLFLLLRLAWGWDSKMGVRAAPTIMFEGHLAGS
mmetsp:Transcript_116794/g.335203  ORF Transcript_116794/g.335203 Transcript_116794/m.335203 type:complete len:218 (-) Transcript_116794:571-1224(-)